ncbi:MAG: mucoidy inhibitor MuiA family protein [Phycisphaerales bacterium]
MLTLRTVLPAAVAIALIAGTAATAQPVEAPGKVDAVTVFRGQALVSRVVDVPGAAGLREIVVTNLPDAVLPASLYAEAEGGAEIRSVSYRVRPIAEDARDEVRKLEDQLRQTRDALDQAKRKLALLDHNAEYLNKLEAFIGGTGTVEMGKGVLNPETISKLSDYLFTTRNTQLVTGDKLRLDIRALEEQERLTDRQLKTITARTSRTAREAIVLVNAPAPGAKVRLNYLVSGASWSPSYNLRSEGKGGEVAVEYQASIQQLSGEDWSNVQMTLSTATPSLLANGPTLQPLAIALAAPSEGAKAGNAAAIDEWRDKSYTFAKKELASRLAQAETTRNMSTNAPPPAQSQTATGGAGGQISAHYFAQQLDQDRGINDLAKQGQLLDLVTSEKFDRKGGSKAAETVALGDSGEEGVSVVYKVSARTTLPSRSDQQLIQIARITCPAELTKVATPVLTSNIFNQARITNGGDLVLLSGPYAAYLGGEFVGHGRVPTVSAGESFIAGFGIDSSLRAARELVERTESIEGGNRVVEFTYRLTMENFGKDAATLRLADRVPQPKGKDIKMTLINTGRELSKDPAYEQSERKLGILKWDVPVPPGSSGTKALAVEYKFKLEYDKQMLVTEK